jgi:hypothetical protein
MGSGDPPGLQIHANKVFIRTFSRIQYVTMHLFRVLLGTFGKEHAVDYAVVFCEHTAKKSDREKEPAEEPFRNSGSSNVMSGTLPARRLRMKKLAEKLASYLVSCAASQACN